MKSIVVIALLASQIFIGNTAFSADQKIQKRTTATDADGNPGMPPGAQGMPERPIIGGMPPGAVGLPQFPPGDDGPTAGMPMPPDHFCRRAAGAEAQNAANNKVEYASLCDIDEVELKTENKFYSVSVSCGNDGKYKYKVSTRKTKKGCLARANLTK
ncbi:MAG: hypothetical protein V4736_02110 [Bdellovibrionota bacterium]